MASLLGLLPRQPLLVARLVHAIVLGTLAGLCPEVDQAVEQALVGVDLAGGVGKLEAAQQRVEVAREGAIAELPRLDAPSGKVLDKGSSNLLGKAALLRQRPREQEFAAQQGKAPP